MDDLATTVAPHATRRPAMLTSRCSPCPTSSSPPEDPAAIGKIARRVYRKHYMRPWKAGARDLWLLGKILDAGTDAMHGELLSYVFFAGEFAEALIRLGRADAQRWIEEHPADLWQLDPLPAWNRPANGDRAVLTPPHRSRVRAITAARELATAPRKASDRGG